MAKQNDTAKELATLRSLGTQVIDLASRLQEKLAPVQEHAPNKRVKKDVVAEAVEKRNKRLNR